MDNLQGKKVGRYWISSLIGHGNRAWVYQASEKDTAQTVAIRLFDRALSADPIFAERFRHLEDALSTVQHPNLLALTAFGEHEGQLYVVRPFIPGGALRRLFGRPLPLDRVIQLLRPIAEALDYAHGQGFVHGDLKPGNILLPNAGSVVLVDLGIAQLLPRGSSLLMAATGRYYGTPEYLSPEQAHGLPLDRRTDEYALGVILYEALLGRPPFRAESPADTPRTIAARHITAAPPSPRKVNPALGAAVEQVLLRGLEKDPERRFPSCSALIAALEEAAGDLPTSTDVLPIPPKPKVTPLPVESAPLRRASRPLVADPVPAKNGTRVLGADDTWLLDQDQGAIERLAAQHAADVKALTARYEAQRAALAETLARQDATIDKLTAQLAEAHEEQVRLVNQIGELQAITDERDRLAARVRELEQPQAPPARPVTAPVKSAAVNEVEELAPADAVGHLSILDPQRFGLPRGATFTLRPGATVGRHPACEIQLNDNFVSTQHARLTREADGWWVTDLGTTNGTFVNEARAKRPTRLNPGDTIRFGRVRATFD